MQCVFLLFWSVFLFPFFISLKFDLNSAWSFFASARLILPSLNLSKRLKALSNLLNFASAVKPLHLYIKSSELTFYLNYLFFQAFQLQIIFIFIAINIFFDCFNFSLVLNWFYLSFPLFFNYFYLFFKSLAKRRVNKFGLFYYLFLIDSNISSPVRYSNLSILSDDKTDIFAAFLLISHCIFSSSVWSSIVMILLFIYLKIFSKSDGKVVLLTKKENGCAVHLL